MTWGWLALAGVGQPLAMEAYRWAPLLAPGDPALARLLVRLFSLSGPVTVMAALAVVPIGHETRICNRVRSYAWIVAFGLMMLAVHAGLEHNLPYRVALLAGEVLLAWAWWCAVTSERRARNRVGHAARLAGFLFACLGVGLCLLTQFALSWDSLLGTVPNYDPFTDTPSLAHVVGVGALTTALVFGSFAAALLLWRAARWRGFHARLLRIGR